MNFDGIIRNIARVLPFSPIEAIFEPSKVCNLRCDYCRRTEEASVCQVNGGSLHMEPYEFKEMLSTLRYLRRANWVGDGEPMMNPDFNKLIEMCSQKGIKTTFGTNGTLVTQKDVDFWKRHKVAEVSVSIDSSIPEKYESMRKGAKFEKVIETCKMVSDAGINLQMQIIAFAETMEEMPKFVDLAIEMGAWRIAFPRPHLYGTLQDRYSGSYPDPAIANPILKIAFDKMRSAHIKWHNPWYITPYFRRCMWPFLSPYIQIGGTIQTCCFIQGTDREEFLNGTKYEIPSTNYNMGNILTDNFAEVWRGDAYKELRHLLIKSEKPIGSTIEIEKLQELKSIRDSRFAHCLGCSWRWSTEC